VVRGRQCRSEADMSTSTDIPVLYREFTDSLTEVLAETAGTPARRGRLARARAAVKRQPPGCSYPRDLYLAPIRAFA
jgi:hypothetical protein